MGDAWMEQSGAFRLECYHVGMFGTWICGWLLSTLVGKEQGCSSVDRGVCFTFIDQGPGSVQALYRAQVPTIQNKQELSLVHHYSTVLTPSFFRACLFINACELLSLRLGYRSGAPRFHLAQLYMGGLVHSRWCTYPLVYGTKHPATRARTMWAWWRCQMHHDADQADTTALAGGYYKGGYDNTWTYSIVDSEVG